MLDSTALEVAIGLVFSFASVALMSTTVNEALSNLIGLRASTLLDGVKALVNDPKMSGLARGLYNHALVNPRGDGQAQSEGQLKVKPSYIDPTHFASALIDLIQTTPGHFEQLGRDINALPDPQMRQLLQGMYARADGQLDKLHNQIASWFDHGMSRVSGAYKRKAHVINFFVGLLLAVALNIDALHLCQALWRHPVELKLAGGPMGVGETLQSLGELPIGWTQHNVQAMNPTALLWALPGWLITASAALMGAPFWYDLLQRLLPLRQAPKTAEKP